MKLGIRFATLLAVMMVRATVVCADTVQLNPVADTTLIETVPNNNLGGQNHVNAGTTQNFTKNHGLFRFDLSGAIPSDAVVTSVMLQLEVTRQPVDGFAAATFELHRVLLPWGEGDKVSTPLAPGLGAPATLNEATWNHRFAGTSETWAAPGGLAGTDFAATASATQVVYDVGNSPYIFGSSAELINDVTYWLANPESNFGWMLVTQNEGVDFTARRFGSREDTVNAPILTIQFEVVPEPGTMALLVAGVVVWVMARRRLAPH
ncbi:MAG: DNRLRE domain-containing protein [Verrucomicrobiota bacterium]